MFPTGMLLINCLVCFSIQCGSHVSAQSCCERRQHSARDLQPRAVGNDGGRPATVRVMAAASSGRSINLPRPLMVDIPSEHLFAADYSCYENEFQRAVERFKHPVVCPVYLCHGSCATTDKPCTTLSNSEILSLHRTSGMSVESYLNLSSSCCVSTP